VTSYFISAERIKFSAKDFQSWFFVTFLSRRK